jgi:hypothetical protein
MGDVIPFPKTSARHLYSRDGLELLQQLDASNAGRSVTLLGDCDAPEEVLSSLVRLLQAYPSITAAKIRDRRGIDLIMWCDGYPRDF